MRHATGSWKGLLCTSALVEATRLPVFTETIIVKGGLYPPPLAYLSHLGGLIGRLVDGGLAELGASVDAYEANEGALHDL